MGMLLPFAVQNEGLLLVVSVIDSFWSKLTKVMEMTVRSKEARQHCPTIAT